MLHPTTRITKHTVVIALSVPAVGLSKRHRAAVSCVRLGRYSVLLVEYSLSSSQCRLYVCSADKISAWYIIIRYLLRHLKEWCTSTPKRCSWTKSATTLSKSSTGGWWPATMTVIRTIWTTNTNLRFFSVFTSTVSSLDAVGLTDKIYHQKLI